MTDDVPKAQCPRCKRWHDDYDGFGVLVCTDCGYCAHPSATNGKCDLCSEPIELTNGANRKVEGGTIHG